MPERSLLKPFLCGLLLCAVVVCVAAAEDATPARPDLAGHWILNGNASEFPGLGPAGGGGGGGGGFGGHGHGGGGRGMWGGGGGGGGHHGGGGGGSGEGGGERGGQGGGRMQLPADMVVELGDSELVVSERGLPVRRLEFGAFRPAGAAVPPDAAKPAGAPSAQAPANGAPPNGVPASGAQAAASPAADPAPMLPAHWEGARIISDYQNRRGGVTHETWELSKDGKQLIIKTALPATSDRPGIEFKRVYDRSEQD